MADPLDRPQPPEGESPVDAPGPGTPAAERPAGMAASPVIRPRGLSGTSRLVLLALAVLAVGAPLLVWLDGRRSEQALRTEVAERLAGMEATAQATSRSLSELAAQARDAQARITLLETRLAESQAQQAALEALYRDLAPSRDEIALSEIEQVLLVASQQLQLAGNVTSALTALQLAEAKLQRLDRPQFLPLRRALARDVDRLKAMPYVDLAGLSFKLDQALAGADKLPLAMDERLPAPPPATVTPPADESATRRFLREVWADLKQLVRVEVADRPAAPLVPPAQQYFLRENLKLRLLGARIALLARDEASFQADLAAVDMWLAQYFDTRAKPVQAMQASVKQLAATPMLSAAPDLAVTLEALRALRLAQERTPAPARSPAPR